MQQPEKTLSQLFSDIVNGDNEAFNDLFRLRYKSLLSFAKNYLSDIYQAEEIISDVFVWLWIHRDKLESVENPDKYLFVTVKNRCLNLIRDTKHFESLENREYLHVDENNSPHKNLEYTELFSTLSAKVENLPTQQKQVFRMVKEGGLSTKQVAEILNLSPRTAETHLYKAVKKLEEEITRYLGYSPKRKEMDQMLSVLW